MFCAGRFSVSYKVTQVTPAPVPVVQTIPEKTFAPDVVSAPASKEKTVAPIAAPGRDWRQLSALPRTPALVAELTAMLEKLATTDPAQALSLAQAEGNLLLRDKFLQATLCGWAHLSATNAAAWAMALTDPAARETAMASVFAGAIASNPDEAVRAGKLVIASHPDDAPGYGSRLIDALCDSGNFEAAAAFSAGGDAQQRSGWMSEAFCKWAELQPAQAAEAASAMSDPVLRNQALHGIVGGWSEADPVGLVQFVTQLPSDNTERGALLGQALDRWARQDPAAASAWINNHQTGPELDQGVAAIATTEGVKPELGVSWADSITDPQLRSQTLNLVLRNWLTIDPAAAKQFFDNTKNLLPDQRKELAEIFDSPTADTAKQ